MNFLKMYYFVVVAEEKNITKAAERLFISQQSLSSHVQKLEKELGVVLFNRTPSLTLTYAGDRFLFYCKKILELQAKWQAELDEINGQTRGRVVIGMSHDRGKQFLPQILPAYSKENPLVDVSLVEGNFKVLQKNLLQGNIDLYIGISPIGLDNANTVKIRQERIFVGVSTGILEKNFPGQLQNILQKYGQGVDIKIFEGIPFLMPPQGNRTRTLFEHVVRKNNMELEVIMETESAETSYALASQNIGIMICTEAFINVLHNTLPKFSDVHFLPVDDPDATGTLIIAYDRDRYLSLAARKFIDITMALFTDSETANLQKFENFPAMDMNCLL